MGFDQEQHEVSATAVGYAAVHELRTDCALARIDTDTDTDPDENEGLGLHRTEPLQATAGGSGLPITATGHFPAAPERGRCAATHREPTLVSRVGLAAFSLRRGFRYKRWKENGCVPTVRGWEGQSDNVAYGGTQREGCTRSSSDSTMSLFD